MIHDDITSLAHWPYKNKLPGIYSFTIRFPASQTLQYYCVT